MSGQTDGAVGGEPGEPGAEVDRAAPGGWYYVAAAALAAVAAVWLESGGGRAFYRADWHLTEVLYVGGVVALLVTVGGLVYGARFRRA